MTTVDTTIGASKPISLRAIFILNALKIVLAFGFYSAFKFYGLKVSDLEGDTAATLMMYTAIAYVVTFAGIVTSILKRSLIGIRTAITVDFLASIPAMAIVGFVVAIISMGLTFTATVRAYFSYTVNR